MASPDIPVVGPSGAGAQTLRQFNRGFCFRWESSQPERSRRNSTLAPIAQQLGHVDCESISASRRTQMRQRNLANMARKHGDGSNGGDRVPAGVTNWALAFAAPPAQKAARRRNPCCESSQLGVRVYVTIFPSAREYQKIFAKFYLVFSFASAGVLAAQKFGTRNRPEDKTLRGG